MRGKEEAFWRWRERIYGLEGNHILPAHFQTTRRYDMTRIAAEAEAFWERVQRLNLERGSWVFADSISDDELVYIHRDGSAELSGSDERVSPEPSCWRLATFDELDTTITTLSQEIARLQCLRRRAKAQAHRWYERLKLPPAE